MRIVWGAVLALLAACGDDKADGNGKASEAKAPQGADAVLEAWKKAGLTVSAFDPADGSKYGDGECRSGTVSGVDAVLCEYGSEDAAKAAQAKGLEVVGTAKSGTALVVRDVMLVLADRRDADPQGKTINQATKIFRGR